MSQCRTVDQSRKFASKQNRVGLTQDDLHENQITRASLVAHESCGSICIDRGRIPLDNSERKKLNEPLDARKKSSLLRWKVQEKFTTNNSSFHVTEGWAKCQILLKRIIQLNFDPGRVQMGKKVINWYFVTSVWWIGYRNTQNFVTWESFNWIHFNWQTIEYALSDAWW